MAKSRKSARSIDRLIGRTDFARKRKVHGLIVLAAKSEVSQRHGTGPAPAWIRVADRCAAPG